MKLVFNVLIVTAVMFGMACSDDFLEVEDKNNLSPDNYPSTMTHLNDMLNGVYGTQHSFGMFGHNMLGKNIYCWDHTTDLSWQGTPQWIALAQNNTQVNDGFLEETWRDAWKGVQRANAFLSGLQQYREEFAAPGQEEELRLMEGQGHFLRAWFYFYLANIWNEDVIASAGGGEKLGLPLLDEVAANLDAARSSRATVRETWDFIISDLKAAETMLSGKVWSGADIHKATEWAAKGLLGKVYVFTQEWNDAKSYLEDVVENSGKSLVSFDVYKDMFNDKNEFNNESLFEVAMNVDRNGWGAWGDQSAGSGIGMVIAPTFLNLNGSPAQSGWSNVFPHDKNITRFGFSLPIPASPSDPDYLAASQTLRDNKEVDPRLYVAMLQPILDSMITENNIRRPISYYWEIPAGEFYAWSFRKYVNLEGTEYTVNVNNGSNFSFLRMADIYLLYAETLIETGEPAIALEYINKVKRRAYDYPPDSPSPVDYTSLTDATSASDPVLGNDPLKYERWAELFGEGHWWFDVRRWKIGEQEAAYYTRVRGGPIQWTDTDYAQPIPLSELLSNVNMRQNAGYPER